MEKEYDFTGGERGALESTAGKTRISIWIDNDILEWFRAQAHQDGGGSYPASINRALREHIAKGR